MVVKLRLVFSFTILFLSFSGFAQTNYWKQEKSPNAIDVKSLPKLDVKKAKVYSLHQADLTKELKTLHNSKNSSKVIHFPDEEGKLIAFKVSERSVLSSDLAKKYPQIKSYSGYSMVNKNDRIRFSVSHNGIQSMIVHADKRNSTFIQKVAKQGDRYVVYSRDSETARQEDFICSTTSDIEKSMDGATLKLVDDQMLRKFRLAISATGEYTQYHGGTVADALGAINATVTRLNEVFETDLGVTLELVSNTDLVIYTNEATDPYDGNLNVQVQNTLTNIIGEANYDLGHLFQQDQNNGNAGFIGSVCVDNAKGSAFSSGLVPEGDLFDLDFVGHEIGHQFGANHTWSFESEGTLVQAEPGSGTTIMGYAGIAQNNNVALNGDDYFHYYSIFQITEYLKTTSCAVVSALTNNPPTINPINDYIIPRSTAFVLTGNAMDADIADVLTYSWEQIDDGVVSNTTFGPNNPSGANFRSQKPSLDPERFFPKLSEIVQGNLTQSNPTLNSAWETVSDVEREMNFALTVRDNSSGGGQVSSELIKVNVVNNAGPFIITSQATNETYIAGTLQNITWDVANTDMAPVNAQTIDVLLSTDGGITFPISLVEGVPNDGVQEVLIPGVSTTTARIMIKAVNNIFLAVNASNITIVESEVVLNFSAVEFEICQPNDLVVPFIYETYSGFNEESTFSVFGIPTGLTTSFSPMTATANNTPVNITFSNTGGVPSGNYPITIRATSLSITKEVTIMLNLYDTNFSDVTLVSPADGLLDAGISQLLQWNANVSNTSYDVEIATEAAFTNIVESATVLFNAYLTSSLQEQVTYYWRVKPKNNCGEGNFGPAFSFTTGQISCTNIATNGLPITITATGAPTVISTITFLDDLPITDVNVNLDISHTWLSDLVISLTSPSGTTVILTSNSCGDLDDISAIFDDSGASIVCGGSPPAINGTVKPLGSLASFNGESTFGEWVLQINDTAPGDGGLLNAFSLDFCAEGFFRPDADKDGVFDDGDDLCLGTPKGTEVDTSGCPVFRFPVNNFSVSIQSESCRNNNDGAISITTAETMNYTVTVMGNDLDISADFTDIYSLDNLSSGTYNVCVSGTDGTIVYEEHCFETVVSEPDPLSVTSKISSDGKKVTLELEGGGLYNIELNGLITQTIDSEITVDLKNGNNTLKVTTGLSCQGTYEEQFFVFDKSVIYPNPVVDLARVILDVGIQEINAGIYSLNGRLLNYKKYEVIGNEIELDFTGYRSGLYIVKLEGANLKGTYKVVKR